MSHKIPAVVLGASGYVGGELLRLIAGHPNFELAAAVSDSYAGTRIDDSFRHLSLAYGEQEFVPHSVWLEKLDPDAVGIMGLEHELATSSLFETTRYVLVAEDKLLIRFLG